MSKIEIKSVEGKQLKELELSDDVYAVEPNMHVMHQAVRHFNAFMRQGTHNTKTRGFVSGGGKKPFRQKGTGRARQGSTRSPHFTGGGVVFGPHPRDYSFRMNKKELKLAMRSALSSKFADQEIVVVEELSFDAPSTKKARGILQALGLDNRRITLVVDDDASIDLYKSFDNLKKVLVLPVSVVCTIDVIDNEVLVLTEAAATRLGEVLA